MNSRFDGILLGYLPYQGEYELKTYTTGILHGRFTERLSNILSSNPSYYHHLINTPCRFIVDHDLRCDRIERTEPD
jgi:hypothetical protein